MNDAELLDAFVRWWMWSLTTWVTVLLAGIAVVDMFAIGFMMAVRSHQ